MALKPKLNEYLINLSVSSVDLLLEDDINTSEPTIIWTNLWNEWTDNYMNKSLNYIRGTRRDTTPRSSWDVLCPSLRAQLLYWSCSWIYQEPIHSENVALLQKQRIYYTYELKYTHIYVQQKVNLSFDSSTSNFKRYCGTQFKLDLNNIIPSILEISPGKRNFASSLASAMKLEVFN